MLFRSTINETFPPFLIFNVSQVIVQVTDVVKLQRHRYSLIGLIYFGDFHFTCRIIDVDGHIWYNDGMQLGRECVQEGIIQQIDPTFLDTARGKRLHAVIYQKSSD